MKEIQSIIVPVDFLQHTETLIEFASYFAKQFSARLEFIHVIEPPHYLDCYEGPSLAEFSIQINKQAEKTMEKLVGKYREIAPDCKGMVLEGSIADSIVKHAEDKKADMIIIGTHGRKGLEKMWLGSVAERVIKKATCPTLTWNPYKSS